MLPVGLDEYMENIKCTSNTNKLKKVLRTFEAESLKLFKNIQPQPKN